VNGSVLTQVSGVNAATYQDSALSTPLPNPIPLNSRGEISSSAGASQQCFLTPNTVYTFTLSDANGNQLWTANYVNGPQITQAQIGGLLYPQTAAEIAASVTPAQYWFPPGYTQRYLANTSPGVTAMQGGWSSAIAQAQQTGGASVTVAGVEYLGANVTIPVGVDVVFTNASSVTIASGYTLTFNGQISAPRIPIFPGPWPAPQGSYTVGQVLFNVGSCDGIYPEWFGAVANATTAGAGTDATNAIAAALVAACGTAGTSSGAVCEIRLNGYYLTANQEMAANTCLRGTSKKFCGFVAKNGTSGTLFGDLGNANGIVIDEVAFYGNSANCASLQYLLNIGATIAHGTEGYLRAVWFRDCACASSGYHAQIAPNIAYYDMISVVGPASAGSTSGINFSGGQSGAFVTNLTVENVGTGTALNCTSPGSVFTGVEIEACAGVNINLTHNATLNGVIISPLASTTYGCFIEIGASCSEWAINGLYYVAGAASVTVSGGNIKLDTGPTYIGGNYGSSAAGGNGNFFSGVNNVISGTASFSGVTSVAVTFPQSLNETNYKITLSQSAASPGGSLSPCWWSSKATGGFTINFGAAFTGSVDWTVTQ
jgi:hypothetical protein